MSKSNSGTSSHDSRYRAFSANSVYSTPSVKERSSVLISSKTLFLHVWTLGDFSSVLLFFSSLVELWYLNVFSLYFKQLGVFSNKKKKTWFMPLVQDQLQQINILAGRRFKTLAICRDSYGSQISRAAWPESRGLDQTLSPAPLYVFIKGASRSLRCWPVSGWERAAAALVCTWMFMYAC